MTVKIDAEETVDALEALVSRVEELKAEIVSEAVSEIVKLLESGVGCMSGHIGSYKQLVGWICSTLKP